MKRATLTNLPAATLGQAEPADLTDRLLEHEQRPVPAEIGAGNPVLPIKLARRRREPASIKRAHRPASVDLASAEAATTGSATTERTTVGSATTETAHRTVATPPTVSIEAALAAADKAALALQDAGRSAPARYDLAVRYRLDALAHHVQQVREFVDGLIPR